MKASGSITRCMAKERPPGKMAEAMKALIYRIKCMGSEYLVGLTEEGMKEAGKLENSTAKGSTFYQMVSLGWENGAKAKKLNGNKIKTTGKELDLDDAKFFN